MVFSNELRRHYEQKAASTNVWLSDLATRSGLGAAFAALHSHQVMSGISDSSSPERYAVGRYFVIVRLNRQKRFGGAGLSVPPAGLASVHNGCFLCWHNVFWKSLGMQVGMRIRLGARRYVALSQPFPIENRHLTIAREDHSPHAPLSRASDIRWVLGDLVELALRLTGAISFVNGSQAGASQPFHHHIQTFLRPFFQFRYPLENAADREFAARPAGQPLPVQTAALSSARYPIATLVAEGPANLVVEQLVRWAEAWRKYSRTSECCGNWIAVGDPDRPEHVRAYFVLRSPFLLRAPGFPGAIAAIETLGQLVISDDDTRARLERGEVSDSSIESVLHSVHPPGADSFLQSLTHDTPIDFIDPVTGVSDTDATTDSSDLVALVAMGGNGTRAGHGPKAMQLVYDKPVAYYLISQAMMTGARHLLLAVTLDVKRLLFPYLEHGEALGLRIDYLLVTNPKGPAELFRRAAVKRVVKNKRVVMVLDGIYIGNGWRRLFRKLGATRTGCAVLSSWVEDPSPFGYLHLDQDGRVTGLTEKRTDIMPAPGVLHPVAGHMSIFDGQVLERAGQMTTAANGEYQLPDLQSDYARTGECLPIFAEDGVWSDAGTPGTLARLAQIVQSVQDNGEPVGAPHWEAYQQGLIDRAALLAYLDTLARQCPYRALLGNALISQDQFNSELEKLA